MGSDKQAAGRRRLRPFAKILLAAGIVLLAIAIAGVSIKVRQDKEYRALCDSLNVTVDESMLRIPYGTEFDQKSFIKASEGETAIEGDVDTSSTGEYPITVTVSKSTSFGKPASKEFPYVITVFDDTIPEIQLEKDRVEVNEGGEFEPASNILAVTDKKDGNLTVSLQEQKGSFWISGEYDLNSAGEYEIQVIAEDLDGNRAEASYTLVVAAKPENTLPYRVSINRALNTVTVYALDNDGSYSLPVRAMVCSTGAATPAGVFHTFNRSAWRALFGGVYGQYATDIVGDILFHSVPYYSMNKGDLEYLEYNKLGTAASMGCIRMCVSDVLWVYNNCPIGTEVEIYDDASNPGPLGKPEPKYIDPESELRGWDPTDPDPANPWNG